MRVAFTLEQCWHDVPGGTAVAALELARALVETGEVDLFGVSARHRGLPADVQWRPPVPMRALPLPRLALYEAWLRFRRPAITGADVVHATTVIVPPRRRVPLVVTVHDLAWRHDPEHFTGHGVRVFNRGLELIRDEADLVFCSSLATLRDCRANGIEEARLRHVPLGVRVIEATDDDVRRVRERYGIRGPYVFFSGTHEPRKNLRGLAAAFAAVKAQHRDLELIVSGPSGWGDTTPTGRTIGFVPSDDLRALHRGAEAFCYPSLWEGFGLPLLEAMAQGTRVVTSRGTSTEEIAEGVGVLVDPRDVDSIAAGLLEALSTETDGSAERRRAAEYTWYRTAQLTVAGYWDVVKT